MADDKQTLQIDIQFESEASVNKKLNNLLKNIQNNTKFKIEFDTNAVSSSLKTLSDELNKINSQLTTAFNGSNILKQSSNINSVTNAYKQQGEAIKQLGTESSKSSKFTLNPDGSINELVSEVTKLNTGLGQTVTIANNAKTGLSTMTQSANFDRFSNTIDTMKTKLNGIKANNFIDDSVIQNLQSKLNSINTDTPEKEIRELQSAITNLGSSDNQIVRVQNTITKMESNLTAMKGKYGNLVGDSSSQAQLKAYEGEVNNLKQTLSDLSGGKTFSGAKISSELNKASSASRELKNSIVQSSSALNLATKDASSLGDTFKRALQNVGIYASTAMLVREMVQGLREASEYIIEIDKRMTNMQMITGQTREQVGVAVDQFKQLGAELHTTNREMLAGAEEVMRAGYDAQTSQQLMSASILGSKISGQSTEQTTEQLIAMKNAFDMTGGSMEHVIDMISLMDNRSATSFSEISQAIQRTAFSAQEAGTPFENLIAYVTTVSEKTRKSAEVIGESFKTIYARYSNIKLGNLDEDGKSINDTERAMQRIGIQIRENEGQFRKFDDVLQEFITKYKSGQITQVDYLAGVQALSGTRQRETLMSLIENVDTLKVHQEDLANSTGMARKMFDEAYSNSLDAKINDLKRSFEGLYESLLNSDVLKTGIGVLTQSIEGVDKVINIFGGLQTTVAIVVGGLTIFNSKFRETTSVFTNCIPFVSNFTNSMSSLGTNLQNSIAKYKASIVQVKAFTQASQQAGISTNGMGMGLAGLQVKLALTTAGLIATRVATIALQTAMTMGISLAITGAISVVGKFGKELIGTGKSMAECKTQADELANTLQRVGGDNNLISQYEKLNEKLKDSNLGETERKNINEQIVDKKKEIGDLDSEYKTVLDNTNLSYQEQLNLLRGIYEQKLKANAQDLDDEMMSQKKAERVQSKLEQNMNAIREYESQGTWQGTTESQESMAKSYEKAKNNVKEYYTELSMYNSNVKLMEEANYSTGRSVLELDSDASGLFNTLMESTQVSNDASDEVSKLGDSVDKTADNFKGLSDAISGSTNKIEMIKQAIKEFNESKDGSISTSLEDKIYASGNAELIAMLGDKNTFLEKANQLLGNEYKLREENKKQIITEAQAEVNATNTKANMYGTDVTNKTNAENAKNTSVQNVLNAMSKMTGETVDELGKKYGIDTTNWNNSQNGKPSAIESVLNEMSRLTGESVNSLADKYGIDARNFAKAQNSKMESMREFARGMISASELVGKTMSVGKGSSIMADNFGGVKSTYNPTPSNYNPVGSTYNSDKASASKKEAEDIKRTADRYLELKNNLDLVNDSLETNKTLQEQAHGQAKIDLINKEIDLLEKRAQAEKNLENAYRNRASSLRSTLSGKGTSFDSSGNISNYNALLESYRNRYNSNKTDANKKAYEDLKELLDEYNTLVRDSITGSMNDYQKTLNEMTNIQNEKAKLIANSESKISDIYKNEVQKRIDEENKAWQKKKELLSKEWTEEDNADTRADLQKELSDIDAQIQQAIVSGDKQLANALRKQYAEKQAELNKVIQDQQREAMTNEIDDKIQANEDKLEELMKPENINKIIQNALQTGMIDVMGETIKLADATKDYVNDTTIGVTNINLAYKEQIDLINEAKKAMLGYAQVSSDLGLSNVATISNINRSVIPQPSNINNGRTVSVAFNSPIVQVEKMNDMDDNKLEEFGEVLSYKIYKKISSVLP